MNNFLCSLCKRQRTRNG